MGSTQNLPAPHVNNLHLQKPPRHGDEVFATLCIEDTRCIELTERCIELTERCIWNLSKHIAKRPGFGEPENKRYLDPCVVAFQRASPVHDYRCPRLSQVRSSVNDSEEWRLRNDQESTDSH